MSAATLKGMTWSHPRGYQPMLACSADWLALTGVAIEWDRRSLQDFESFPVVDLARRYDLIVIDHPHVGQITTDGCLAPLDAPERAGDLAALAAGSVGKSFPSYAWQGRQWAFPIDAATQVSAWRPDRLPAPPTRWGEVIDIARRGEVVLPLKAPHSLMCFLALTGNLGRPCSVDRRQPFADREAGTEALEAIRELAALIDPACPTMDPITALDSLSAQDSRLTLAPLIYGYVNYSFAGFRAHRVAFADMPMIGALGPVGSALGGTGIAVSAFSAHRAEAIDFAYWIAGGQTQSTRYLVSGGQPGHAAAWESEAANAATLDFYRATRQTLEGAQLRPRHDGYMPFQEAASALVNEAVAGAIPIGVALDRLNDGFASSFKD
ncbi:MAG: extracellular solute-binding protein [Ancalomicrobiaceae bacterium]|nr:extracellular solute-binding protein [Ancalomicrobiaceae bacterium]